MHIHVCVLAEGRNRKKLHSLKSNSTISSTMLLNAPFAHRESFALSSSNGKTPKAITASAAHECLVFQLNPLRRKFCVTLLVLAMGYVRSKWSEC